MTSIDCEKHEQLEFDLDLLTLGDISLPNGKYNNLANIQIRRQSNYARTFCHLH